MSKLSGQIMAAIHDAGRMVRKYQEAIQALEIEHNELKSIIKILLGVVGEQQEAIILLVNQQDVEPELKRQMIEMATRAAEKAELYRAMVEGN